jgi:biopolymer transport protein ExbB
MFKGFALIGAEWVMWLLLLISFLSVAIIIERLVFFFGQRTNPDAIIAEIRTRLGKNDIDGLLEWLSFRSGPTPAIARAALEHFPRGAAAIGEAASSARIVHRQSLEKNLAYLGTAGNIAPFIGLLGTVIGIISAFHELSLNTAGGASTVMGAISEALVTTALGLMVAIPAVSTYNAFQRRIKALMGDADSVVHAILSISESVSDTRNR